MAPVTLHLHNTMTRAKARFVPLDPANVRVYVCGPTVYDLAHIGNARPVVVFDVLFRLLRHLYGADRVTYARNITDVEDKIIVAAKASGESIDAVTARTTEAFHHDMAALGALAPSIEPRATDHIPQMIAMIEALIERGHAYEVDGHVLFSVQSMPEYGRLSRHSRDELIAGARVEVAPYKKDPADFVLWKPSTAAQPGWDSPWGRGRPGWHIECSAMSAAHLGEHFDIHGGGQDLIFPHHENEIAQSLCAHDGRPFVNVWMHNGYVVVEGEKMSKSLGNFKTVRQLLEKGARGEAIRLALLTTHYRQPLDFTSEGLEQAKRKLDQFYDVLMKVRDIPPASNGVVDLGVVESLSDDLNTHQAIYLHLDRLVAILSMVAERGNDEEKAKTKASVLESAKLLGLLQNDPESWRKGLTTVGRKLDLKWQIQPSNEEIERKIAERMRARKSRDFEKADEIRAWLGGFGIVLEDGPQGTTWRRA